MGQLVDLFGEKQEEIIDQACEIPPDKKNTQESASKVTQYLLQRLFRKTNNLAMAKLVIKPLIKTIIKQNYSWLAKSPNAKCTKILKLRCDFHLVLDHISIASKSF